MTEKLTYLDPQWSRGEFAELPRLRARYGDAVAGAAEYTRFIAYAPLNVPTAPQVKAALKRVAERGSKVPLEDLDDSTRVELLSSAVAVYGTVALDRLPDEALHECARVALARFTKIGGRPSTDGPAVDLVAKLLQLWDKQLREIELQRIRDHVKRRPVRRHIVGGGVEDEDLHLARARRRLIRLTLHACGIGSGDQTVARLVKAAGGVF